jgi:Spy/CpxP family protein refolding chaperone
MKMTKLSLVAALALGGLLACTTLATAQDNGGGKKGGRMTVEQRLDRMTTELTLTDAQKPKVKAVLDDTAAKMKDVPADQRREKMPAIREEETKKLKEILTPEQFVKYEAMARGGKKGGEKKADTKTQ